jgi:hypothetical protein
MEAPSWDCDWYWGCGYIEEYSNNANPEMSRDIVRHSHWDNGIVNFKDTDNNYIHHINENKDFQSTALTDKESWALSELMQTIYQLKKQAELYHTGGSQITTNPLESVLKDKKKEDEINKDILPKLFEEVIKILEPKKVSK